MEKKQIFFLATLVFCMINILGYILIPTTFPTIASISHSGVIQDGKVPKTLHNRSVHPLIDKQGVEMPKIIHTIANTVPNREQQDVLLTVPNREQQDSVSVRIQNGSYIPLSNGKPKRRPFKTSISNIVHSKYDAKINISITKSGKLDTLLYEHYANIEVDEKSTCEGRKFLIYTCSYQKQCGGLGDRQKGMASTFLLALLTNRTFVVDIRKPCDILNHLEPNIYDWTHCKQYIKTIPDEDRQRYKVEAHRYALIHDRLHRNWQKTAIFVDVGSYFNVIMNIRRSVLVEKRLSWIKYYSDEEVIAIVLRSLFKHKPILRDHLTNFFKHSIKGRQLVCGHIRIGRNPSNPFDTLFRGRVHVPGSLEKMNMVLKKFSDPKKFAVYLATDSDHVRREAAKKVKNYINVNRRIVHIDKTFNLNQREACDGVYTALFEQYVLTKCDYLMIGRSNFAANAAYLRGHSKGLYVYDQKTNYLPAQLKDIQSMYHLR